MENKKLNEVNKVMESLKESALESLAKNIAEVVTLLIKANDMVDKAIFDNLNDIDEVSFNVLIKLLSMHHSTIKKVHERAVSLKHAFEEISKINFSQESSLLSILDKAQEEADQSLAILIEKMDKKFNLGEDKHTIIKELHRLSQEEQDGK